MSKKEMIVTMKKALEELRTNNSPTAEPLKETILQLSNHWDVEEGLPQNMVGK